MSEGHVPPPVPRLLTAAGGLVPILIVVVAAVLPRVASLRSDLDFVWDDRVLLAEDSRIGRLSSIPESFVGPYIEDRPESMQYRPLVNVTLTLERALFGEAGVLPHRIMNLLLHVLASVLLFLVARRVVPDRPVVPLLAAVLFAEHPVTTEVVSWIVARADSGAAVFSLLAILLWLRRRPGALAGAVGCLFAALLFKPVAAIVPAVLVLIEVNREGRSFADLRRASRLVPLLLLFLPIVVVFLMRHAASGGLVPAAQGVVLRDTDILQRLILGGGLLVRNLGALILPVNLTGDYQADPAWRTGPSAIPPAYLFSSILVIAGIAWLIYRRRRGGLEVFGILWAVLFLLPVLQIVPIGALLADRFLYLPAMGIALAGASALDRLAGGAAAWGIRARIVGVGLSFVLSAFFALDLARSAAYHDDGAFNRHVLRRFPDETADGSGKPWRREGLAEIHVRLGLHAEREATQAKEDGDLATRRREWFRAEANYIRAAELDPEDALPHLRLGSLRLDQRRVDEAIHELQLALGARAGPFRRAAVEYDLARALIAKVEWRVRRTEAVAHDPMTVADGYLRKALRRRPRFPAALFVRGRILVRYLGQEEEGRRLLREAVALDPRLADRARRWLHRPRELAQADLLVKNRRFDEALELLRAAVARYDEPTSKARLEHLMASILVRRVEKFTTAVTPGGVDQIGEAEGHLRRALGRWPRFPRAHLLLGYILLEYRDRPEEGRRLLRKAAALDPRLEQNARRHLGGNEEND